VQRRSGERSGASKTPLSLPKQGIAMLSSDPRFLGDVRRIMDNAPSWKPYTQSTHACGLALIVAGLAGIGLASELNYNRGVDLLSGPMMGSAALLFIATLCWRFRGLDKRTQAKVRSIHPPKRTPHWRELGRAADRVRARMPPDRVPRK
jgi:hypothetical protein